jgi:hypothetical protein
MGRHDRRVYAPPVRMRGHYDDAHAPPRRQAFVFGVMCVVVAAFSGVVWGMYGGAETPRVRAPDSDYKIRPPAEAAPANALYDVIEGREEEGAVTPAPPPEAPLAEPTPAPRRPLGVEPRFTADGPFVAQVAALRSESGVDGAWRRLARRAPGVMHDARMDVVRADLGQRGIYYRVRAGYFEDRANAALFCDRIRMIGQDCIVVAR